MLLADNASVGQAHNVLMVEPDWDTVEAFGDMSGQLIRSLHWAGTMTDALDVVSQGRVDTLVIDLRPPVGEDDRLEIEEGLRLIRYLSRRRHHKVQTIVLAGARDMSWQVACFGAGASEFVVRDSDPKLLARKLCMVIQHLGEKKAA